MKAYIVSCTDDDHGCEIAFASNATAARQRGRADLCDCDYIQLRVRRAPELDKHSPGPVPIMTLMQEHGWYFFCHGCERHVYADCDGHVIEGESVFCSEACQKRHHKYVADFHTKLEAMRAEGR